jgi:2-succinyl-6-hydroxy-2,4-cyclohexadiene-1-carboxylate synthase
LRHNSLVPHVVLIPGFTQTAASWAPVREVVDASCDVTAVEVPRRDTFEATARSIGVRGQHAIYVGYSMGGRLALRLAIDHPELVQGLVLVSMAPGIPDAHARAEREVSDEKLAREVEHVGTEAFLASWLAQPLFATVPADAPGLAERNALAPAYIAHCLRVLGAGAMRPMWDQLGRLTMPVGLVTGRLDTKYETIAEQMLERISGDVSHVSFDCGHAVPLEQPAVLGGYIAAFAAQHG